MTELSLPPEIATDMVMCEPENETCSLISLLILLSTEADYVALGMNLDDYSQSILMNVARGDVDRLARMAPHSDSRDGIFPAFE